MLRLFFIFLTFICFSRSKIGELKQLVVEKKINKVEDFFKEFSGQKKITPLIFNSHSDLPASPEMPRVIEFFGDARLGEGLYLSYASNPLSTVIQFAEYNKATGFFDWGEFDQKSGEFLDRPEKCLVCHNGPNGEFRLLVDSYPDWSGWYGQHFNNAFVGKGTQGVSRFLTKRYEKELYKKFLEKYKNNPRLRHLEFPGDLSKLGRKNMEFSDQVIIFSAKTSAKHFINAGLKEKIGALKEGEFFDEALYRYASDPNYSLKNYISEVNHWVYYDEWRRKVSKAAGKKLEKKIKLDRKLMNSPNANFFYRVYPATFESFRENIYEGLNFLESNHAVITQLTLFQMYAASFNFDLRELLPSLSLDEISWVMGESKFGGGFAFWFNEELEDFYREKPCDSFLRSFLPEKVQNYLKKERFKKREQKYSKRFRNN